jgi:hypothetical protein
LGPPFSLSPNRKIKKILFPGPAVEQQIADCLEKIILLVRIRIWITTTLKLVHATANRDRHGFAVDRDIAKADHQLNSLPERN